MRFVFFGIVFCKFHLNFYPTISSFTLWVLGLISFVSINSLVEFLLKAFLYKSLPEKLLFSNFPLLILHLVTQCIWKGLLLFFFLYTDYTYFYHFRNFWLWIRNSQYSCQLFLSKLWIIIFLDHIFFISIKSNITSCLYSRNFECKTKFCDLGAESTMKLEEFFSKIYWLFFLYTTKS